MSDYTPPTEVIRQAVTFERNRLGEPRTISVEKFERWLTKNDAEVAAKALEEAADALPHIEGTQITRQQSASSWLREHAAEYRKTETED